MNENVFFYTRKINTLLCMQFKRLKTRITISADFQIIKERHLLRFIAEMINFEAVNRIKLDKKVTSWQYIFCMHSGKK